MLATLLAICIGLLIARYRRSSHCLRRVVIDTLATFGILLTVITEALSPWHELRPAVLAWIWGGIDVGLLLCLQWRRPPRAVHLVRPTPFSWLERSLLAINVLLIAAVVATALLSPPNNWDSMTYHSARVEHWRQAASVAHYPTSIPRQLFSYPGAEYIVLHLRLLSGGDQFAGLVQATAMIGCAVGVSLLAKLIGLNRLGQILASTVALTLPNGLLQASGTQNNYVAAFWLLSFLVYTIDFLRTPTWRTMLATGATLALTVLTKPTASVFALPFLAWLVVGSLQADWKKKRLPRLAAIGLFVLAINGPFWWRNWQVIPSPFASPHDAALHATAFGLRLLASNVIRYAFIHFGVDTGSNDWWNKDVFATAVKLHQWLGLSINDPRITVVGQRFFIAPPRRHEDLSGNGMHLLLAVAAAVASLFAWRRPADRLAVGITGLSVAAALLFLAVFKWQPYEPRLELPIFVVMAAPTAWLLQRGPTALSGTIVVLLVALAVPQAFANRSRPLLGRGSVATTPRVDVLFANNRPLEQPYREAADALAADHVHRIDLVSGGDDFEYPFWPLMAERGDLNFLISFAYVNNESAKCANPVPAGVRPLVLTDVSQREVLRSLKPGWREQDFGPLTIFWPR